MYRVSTIFRDCVSAIRDGILITRQSEDDKEFHFQNWFKGRLDTLQLQYHPTKRNTYPDFRLKELNEGYELKGLQYPGRWTSYDSNSQVPRGEHNGEQVFYVFGRYPKKPDGNSYQVEDLVVCHGSFLNANSDYVHKNKSFKGFGSYGDILVRDRKMYVAPTPFAVANGLAHRRTLILPAEMKPESDMVEVGQITRKEVADLIISYSFDLKTNVLETKTAENPNAGRIHEFKAYRVPGDPAEKVEGRSRGEIIDSMSQELAEDS